LQLGGKEKITTVQQWIDILPPKVHALFGLYCQEKSVLNLVVTGGHQPRVAGALICLVRLASVAVIPHVILLYAGREHWLIK
jgi:hypothetical protein